MTEDEERWAEKTASPIGVDLSVPPPVMRYQYLNGVLHTLQLFPDGAIARGTIPSNQGGFEVDEEGWYDENGGFLGEDPKLPAD